FRYNKADKKAVISNLHNATSDYFKPTGTYTSDQSLLKDSLYVKTFKYYAAKKTRARRTTKTLLFIGGGVVIVTIALLFAATYTASVTSYN
ncbi:MAG: hypothetical protein ACXVA2_13485, partial [Mucilaginibacter sp.]